MLRGSRNLFHIALYIPHKSKTELPISKKSKLKQAKNLILGHSLTIHFIDTELISFITVAIMAFRSMSYLRSMMGGIRGSNRATYATSTTPKLKAYAPPADFGHFQEHQQRSKTKAIRGDFVPVYVAIGMIVLSTTLGLHTVMQQLRYSPGVRVKKKERETLPEVYLPDKVVDEADKFMKKSFFRKVAHVQEFEYGDHPISDPIRKDAFAHKPRVETLKSVGVDPTPH